MVEQQNPGAESAHRLKIVGHQHDRLALFAKLIQASVTLGAKLGIAYCQHLINQQNIGIYLRGDGKSQTHEHAGRILLNGRINEVSQSSKIEDLLFAFLDRAPGKPEQETVQDDVLASRQVVMKSCSQLDQRSHAALHRNFPQSGTVYPGNDL